ncbi:MAG: lactonase family protein, partial [Burkholderiaceae bacterium]
SPRHGAPLRHALLVFRLAPGSGALTPHGEPLPLPSMAVHLAIDPSGTRLLAACYEPSAVLAWQLGADGRPRGDATRLGRDAIGVFAHQAAFSPRGDRAVVCARGNDARPGHAEDSGSLTALAWRGGAPTPTDRLTMPPGLGPRDLVFHPSRPLLYVAMERGNALQAIGFENGRFARRPAFAGTTLAAPDAPPPATELAAQRAGAIALHPQGHALYVANRSGNAWPAGENNVAVYRIDPDTGLPALHQHADARGIEPRSLALDAGGALLAVGNQIARPAKPAGIALFRVAPDGRLADAGYAVPSRGLKDGAGVNWAGFATPPA